MESNKIINEHDGYSVLKSSSDESDNESSSDESDNESSSDTDDSDSELSSDDEMDEEDEIDIKGKIIDGKYIILYKLGGGISTVWLSYHIHEKKYYAIKVLNKKKKDEDDDDSEDNDEDDELGYLKKINKGKCPYLNKFVRYFEYHENGETYLCIVFDLMAGSLYDVMKTGKYKNGLPVDVVRRVTYQLLIAMDELNNKHKLLHTDIKPENILVVGISKRIQTVINKFESLNIHPIWTKGTKWKKGTNAKKKWQTIANMVISTDFDVDNNESDKCAIDEKYIENNILTQLSDFGNCCELDDEIPYEIQTRYYMAPEVLLEYDLNIKCDMWSVGCVIYELLTGEMLFDPDKTRGFNRDRHHLYDIQTALGLIPENLIKKSKKRKLFFRNNGLLKGTYKIKYEPLYKKLAELNGNNNMNNTELLLITDLMYKLFQYDSNDRPTPRECKNHEWFNSLHKKKKKKHKNK
uniref:non-specific serine/threonine protein kinase n=1 Tax=Mimivirus LCMiAC01 TaxID=2506608 RepID=A0A481Z0H6_9VIRU|nr:MAG: dual-specificity protein kinase [Mimivirus LCMiAC01]